MYGAYGVVATQEFVELSSRVRIPLGTQNIKTPKGVFIFCPEVLRDSDFNFLQFLSIFLKIFNELFFYAKLKSQLNM